MVRIVVLILVLTNSVAYADQKQERAARIFEVSVLICEREKKEDRHIECITYDLTNEACVEDIKGCAVNFRKFVSSRGIEVKSLKLHPVQELLGYNNTYILHTKQTMEEIETLVGDKVPLSAFLGK